MTASPTAVYTPSREGEKEKCPCCSPATGALSFPPFGYLGTPPFGRSRYFSAAAMASIWAAVRVANFFMALTTEIPVEIIAELAPW
jgi:hypothetical protein